nr:hypothetical protein [Notoacmeibacter marinus]
MKVKRAYRLYTELGLQIRNKRPKRKVSAKLREDRRPPQGSNDVWLMDFLSDRLFDGRKIRGLITVGAFSKIAPADNSFVEAIGHDYNHVRPHSSICLKTPVEFMKSIGRTNQPTGS